MVAGVSLLGEINLSQYVGNNYFHHVAQVEQELDQETSIMPGPFCGWLNDCFWLHTTNNMINTHHLREIQVFIK